MITQQQYLEKQATHREYYAQFVTENIKERVLRRVGLESLKRARHDEHLNSIALPIWDQMANCVKTDFVFRKMKECGAYGLSLSSCVCILKEAARQIIEEDKN